MTRRIAAGALTRRLQSVGVVCDHRNDRLRLGFGIYHDAEDVAKLCRRMLN